ncbi:protein takeout [Drosophila subobscura]|uniref:protein takeout n=1 Tax=Drosophila subobscura TaxID=7241 RepID=UPI00155AE04D|nr:protein takeout [Drosophila subobscura]
MLDRHSIVILQLSFDQCQSRFQCLNIIKPTIRIVTKVKSSTNIQLKSMNRLQAITWLCCICIDASLAAELPEDIEKCRFGDSPCLVRTLNDLIKRYPKGIPEIGLPPLDKYSFPDTSVLDSPHRGPIWMTFHMRDNVHKGFNNATVTHVEGFLQDPTKQQIILKARLPRLVHDATYDMQGRFMLFVMNATGKLQSDFQNFRVTLTIKVILEYRNNKRYLNIYDMVPVIDLDRLICWFDNLYRENEDVTIALNNSFNKHWLEFWNELEPALLRSFSAGFTVLLSTVFEKVAYDDMFLPDIDIRIGHRDD